MVMDCRNGEVLAMATNPSFDPSLFNSGVSQAQWVEWTNEPRTPLINKAAAGLYAPGSTFKMAVALAGLTAGAVAPYDRINCPGYLDLGDTRFHCWRKGGHGTLDLHGGLKNSCDVFFYEVARRTGIDRMRRDGQPLRPRHRSRHRLPASAGLMPTRAWRQRTASLEHRRHGRLRHRPGLHPADAAGARAPMPPASPPGAPCSRI